MVWDIVRISAALFVLIAVPFGFYKHRCHISLYQDVLNSMKRRGVDVSAFCPTFWTKYDASGAMIKIRRLTAQFRGRFTDSEWEMIKASRRCYYQQAAILVICAAVVLPVLHVWIGGR